MNQKSPFEQWRENHLYQIAVSPEILKLIAEAFQGGRLYEMQPFQKREWVGLTDDEIGSEYVRFEIQGGFNRFEYAVKALEAKLKDKNNGIILTGEMLLKAAQSSLAPEQYDHFEAMSKHQPDIYDRLAYAIRVQDE